MKNKNNIRGWGGDVESLDDLNCPQHIGNMYGILNGRIKLILIKQITDYFIRDAKTCILYAFILPN